MLCWLADNCNPQLKKNLMSSRLQSPSESVPKSLKAQNAAMANLLMSWGSMPSPVLKMQATSQNIQPSTPSL